MTCTFHLKEIFADTVPFLDIDTTNLIGSSIVVDKERQQEASQNIIWSPIPNDMLSTGSETSPVVVTIGTEQSGTVESVCNMEAGCSYKTDPAIKIPLTSFGHDLSSTSSSQLTLNFGDFDTETIQVQESRISISFAGNQFTISDFSDWPNSIVAETKITENNKQRIEAGTHTPIVHFLDYGFASIDQGVADDIISPVVDAISPNTGSNFGGTKVTIEGNYFPIKGQGTLKVMFGNTESTDILQVSNTKIKAVAPLKEDADPDSFDISVVVNGESVGGPSYGFSHDGIPKITGLSIDNASPVLKTPITITGSGFGTEASEVQVFLFN